MDFPEKGIMKLEAILKKQFVNETIDKIPRCGSSNACEVFLAT
jgi:hypothetical protein